MIYANCFKKNIKTNNIDAFISEDCKRFKARYPSIRIDNLSSLPIKDGKEAILKSFVNPNGGQQGYEAVAYIDDELIIAIITLSTADKKHFNDLMPIFRTVVSSYLFHEEMSDGLSLQDLEQLYQQNISKPGGREYACKAIKAFWGNLAFMRECAPPNAPTAESFTIFFQVLPNGRMGQIYLFPETSVGKCIKKHVLKRNFPMPAEPFVVRIRLAFTE